MFAYRQQPSSRLGSPEIWPLSSYSSPLATPKRIDMQHFLHEKNKHFEPSAKIGGFPTGLNHPKCSQLGMEGTMASRKHPLLPVLLTFAFAICSKVSIEIRISHWRSDVTWRSAADNQRSSWLCRMCLFYKHLSSHPLGPDIELEQWSNMQLGAM